MLTSTTPTFRIWHPDVYFANARIAQFHEVTQPNFLLWISPNGSILYDTRVSMTVICAMQLQNFPLDSQWCHLRILSCKIWSSCSWKASFSDAYDEDQLTISWTPNDPITKNSDIAISDMHVHFHSNSLIFGMHACSRTLRFSDREADTRPL